MNKLVSRQFGGANLIDWFSIEEANFDWPAYLLGDEDHQPIVSIDPHDESINDDDRIDPTLLENETSEEIEMEYKPIDEIEQQN